MENLGEVASICEDAKQEEEVEVEGRDYCLNEEA